VGEVEPFPYFYLGEKSMLTQELRPKKLSDLVGNDINKKIVDAIIQRPEDAPRVLIFQGAWGSGKTSMARILARGLNKIPIEKDILKTAEYMELDASVVGNKQSLMEYGDVFVSTIAGHYKVITIDEIHMASKASQNLLLKIFEEAPRGIFFVLCTTEVDKVIDTIRSRALELTFETNKAEDVAAYIKKVAEGKGVAITDSVCRLIADNSEGHMRDAVMEFAKYEILGDDYEKSVKDLNFLLCKAVEMVYNRDKEVESIIKEIYNTPMVQVRKGIRTFITGIAKVIVDYGGGEIGLKEQAIKEVAGLIGKENAKRLISVYYSDWFMNAWRNELDFMAAFRVWLDSIKLDNKVDTRAAGRRVEFIENRIKL